MIPSRSLIARALFAAVLSFLAGAGSVLAQDAPVDLHAPATKRAKPAKDAKDAPKPPPMSAADAVSKANAYFNEMRVMSADFVQIGPDGSRSEGELYLVRPGKMLFKFSPPGKLEIVADGRSVAVRDQKLGTQDLYFIGQTPLKFLLADNLDLAKDTKVKRVEVDENAVMIEIEDKAAFGGTAEITLVFDPETFALKQWTVTDAQGFQTVVSLFNIDLVTKPDPALFHIDDTPAPGSPRRH
jgi:outer membrane lipoprotein-sorting protein